jgi:hypothetical protein
MGSPTLLVIIANSSSSFLQFSYVVQPPGDEVSYVGSVLSVFLKIQAFCLSIPLGFYQGF